jgi:hypothetical protein
MKTRIKFLIVATMAAMMAQTGRPDLVTGSFAFSGSVDLDNSTVSTSTGVANWNSGSVALSNGSFASIPYGTAMTFAPNFWKFNTTAPVTNFWNVGGFKFELQSSKAQLNYQFGSYYSLSAGGTAVVSGNGYTPTVCEFMFSTQDPTSGLNGNGWQYQYSVSLQATATNGEPVLASAVTTKGIVLSWSDPTFSLQSAPTLNGNYNNIPSAVSPYTNAFTGSSQYFRLKQ